MASKKQPDYNVAHMSRTRNLVAAILERVELLLHVTIETERPPSPGTLARSVSQIPSAATSGKIIIIDLVEMLYSCQRYLSKC